MIGKNLKRKGKKASKQERKGEETGKGTKRTKGSIQQIPALTMPESDRYRVRGRHSRTMNKLFLIEVGDNDKPFVMYLSYPVSPARLFFCLGGLIFLLVSVAALPLSLLCGSSTSPSVWREAAGAKGPIRQE